MPTIEEGDTTVAAEEDSLNRYIRETAESVMRGPWYLRPACAFQGYGAKESAAAPSTDVES